MLGTPTSYVCLYVSADQSRTSVKNENRPSVLVSYGPFSHDRPRFAYTVALIAKDNIGFYRMRLANSIQNSLITMGIKQLILSS